MEDRAISTNIVMAATLLLLLVAGVWLLYIAASVVKEIAGAILVLGTGIILAFVKHQLELAKDRQSRQKILKQENYKQLLSNIADFARNPKERDDAIVQAHLGSIAFGDSEVILATNKFIEEPSKKNLLHLVEKIRREVMLPELKKDFWDKYNQDILFPTRKGLKE